MPNAGARVLLRVTFLGELPDFRLSANSRKGRLHHMEEHVLITAERTRWAWLLKMAETVGEPLVGLPFKARVAVTFAVRHRDNRRRDPDGQGAAFKPILDAMVDLAWLYGDDGKWVKSVTSEVLDDGEPRTVVTIETLGTAAGEAVT